MLPDTRRDEVRSVLRKAVDLTARSDVEDRDIAFGNYASMQAQRGFFEDALQTALRVHNTEELVGAYRDIGIAQAAQGHADDARRTFVLAEAQARKYGLNAERHAQLTDAIAKAGLLPEAFAQVQAMSRWPRGEYLSEEDLDAVIQAHIRAGQLGRAFEIASLMSEHDFGNPHYFLVIARAL
jgi:hypothetical protein